MTQGINYNITKYIIRPYFLILRPFQNYLGMVKRLRVRIFKIPSMFLVAVKYFQYIWHRPIGRSAGSRPTAVFVVSIMRIWMSREKCDHAGFKVLAHEVFSEFKHSFVNSTKCQILC